MAEKKSKSKPDLGTREVARKVSDGTDGGDSRLTKGYKDNPDKPDPSSIAQVEELVEE